jgi:hypothetical protein
MSNLYSITQSDLYCTDSRSRNVLDCPITGHHTSDYTCGKCGTVLMHAEDAQVRNLVSNAFRPALAILRSLFLRLSRGGIG